MALIEELEKSGNWLFRWRSFLPLILFAAAFPVVLLGWHTDPAFAELRWWLPCLLVSLLGQTIRAITIGYTPRGTSGRNTSEGQVAESLNTRGIYGTVRHPLYVGNFFMWMGIVLFTGSWWFSLAVVLLFCRKEGVRDGWCGGLLAWVFIALLLCEEGISDFALLVLPTALGSLKEFFILGVTYCEFLPFGLHGWGVRWNGLGWVR